MRNVAVIGAGISGLAAAYLLSRRHRVHLFEQQPRLGGHTNTVVIDTPGGRVPLDTGFLVHNDRTYPNLVRLFGELGVATYDSDMSFAVSCRRSGLEYSSRGLNGFFAQRRNLGKSSHLLLLREIRRFNREAPALLRVPDAEQQTLGDFLESRRFSEAFTHQYLLPMALCADGRAKILFHDVLHHGHWQGSATQLTATFDDLPVEFASSSTLDFVVDADGNISADAIYGGRAFSPTDRDFTLCP